MFRRLAVQSVNTSVAVRGLSTTQKAVFTGAFLPEKNVADRVLKVLTEVKFVPETVNVHTKFSDLQLDSLLKKDLFVRLSTEFCVNIPGEVTDGFHSVANVVSYFSTHPKAR